LKKGDKKARLKALNKRLKEVVIRHRKAQKNVKELNEEIACLKHEQESLGAFKFGKTRFYVGSRRKIMFSVNGVWIVAKHEGDNVILRNFYELIRSKEGQIVKTITLDGILKKTPLIGSDNKEVTLKLGDLLFLSKKEEISKGFGFHMANIIPKDEKGQLQYEFALYKLDLGPKPQSDEAFLIIDGNFREVN
jgi:hypothetical protein